MGSHAHVVPSHEYIKCLISNSVRLALQTAIDWKSDTFKQNFPSCHWLSKSIKKVSTWHFH